MESILCGSQKYSLKLKYLLKLSSLNQSLIPGEIGGKYIFYASKKL